MNLVPWVCTEEFFCYEFGTVGMHREFFCYEFGTMGMHRGIFLL